MWHIPGTNITIDLQGDDDGGSSYSSSSSYSAYNAYSAYSAYARRLAGSYGSSSYGGGSSGNSETFTPMEQMKYNVDGASHGFAMCLVLNNILYIFKWMEISTNENASPGARSIAQHLANTYIGCCVIYLAAAVAARFDSNTIHHPEENRYSVYCVYIWAAGTLLYFSSFLYW
jgi:uncharacterized membrane protein